MLTLVGELSLFELVELDDAELTDVVLTDSLLVVADCVELLRDVVVWLVVDVRVPD